MFISFPDLLNSKIEPCIYFQSLEWSNNKDSRFNTINPIKNTGDIILLPMTNDGLISKIENKWEEKGGIRQLAGALEGGIDWRKTGEFIKTQIARLAQTVEGKLGEQNRYNNGITINDFSALMFEGTELRTFDFTWKLYPSSQIESERLANIIRIFKYHSLAEYGESWKLCFPDIWNINIIMPNGKSEIENNTGLSRIKIQNCVCTHISDSYFVEGKVPLADGSSSCVGLELSFMEILPITKSTYKG